MDVCLCVEGEGGDCIFLSIKWMKAWVEISSPGNRAHILSLCEGLGIIGSTDGFVV